MTSSLPESGTTGKHEAVSGSALDNSCFAWLPLALRERAERLAWSPLWGRLASGAFWSALGAAFSRVFALAASVVAARILSTEEFGEWGILQSTVGMLGVFAGFGLGLTATKFVAECFRRNPQRAADIIALSNLFTVVSSGAMTGALLFSASWMAGHTLAAPHLAGPLRVGSLLLFFGGLGGAFQGVLYGLEAFRQAAWLNLAAGMATFLFVTAGAYFGSLQGLMWGAVAASFVQCVLTYLVLRRVAREAGIPTGGGDPFREWKLLGRFSLPAVLSGSMVVPANWLCGLILVNRPGGYAEMANYTAANQWFNALLLLPGVLGPVVLPMLSEGHGDRDKSRQRRILKASIQLNSVIVLPLVAVGAIASPWIMGFYGTAFRSSWPTLVVALITAGLLATQTSVGHLIAASARLWIGFLMNLGWAICFIIASYLFVDRGSLGLASARLLAYLVHGVWTFAFAFQVLRNR